MHSRRGETRRSIQNFMLSLGGVLLAVAAAVTPAQAGILDASWTAPTTNLNSTPLMDLASYRIYYGLASSPCPGSSYVQVASPTSSPAPATTISARLSGLSAGSLY